MLFVIALPILFPRESPLQLSRRESLQRKNRVENISKQQNKNFKEEETFNSTQWWYFENYPGHGLERLYIIMSITPGKKFLVIPSDIYDRLTKNPVKSYQPEKSELIKLEEEMQSVWDSSAPPHEKVKPFTEELNKFKSLLKTMAEPLKGQIQQQNVQQTPLKNSNNEILMKESYENDETIIQGLTKANRKKDIVLLDFLKMHPDRIMWNGKGKMIYQGKTFYGSNISHLISDFVGNRKKLLSQTFHGSAFVKAFADLDVPEDLVRNTTHSQMLEVYKTDKLAL